MSNGTQFFVVLADGRRFGPASMEVLYQWAREGRIPGSALLEPADGSAPPRSVLAEPQLASVIGAPPTVAGNISKPIDDEEGPSLIPYKNGYALAAYYTSVASLIPIFGILLGLIAIVLGIMGIKRYRENPKVKGIAHAWVGIILGSICVLGYCGLIVAIAVSAR